MLPGDGSREKERSRRRVFAVSTSRNGVSNPINSYLLVFDWVPSHKEDFKEQFTKEADFWFHSSCSSQGGSDISEAFNCFLLVFVWVPSYRPCAEHFQKGKGFSFHGLRPCSIPLKKEGSKKQRKEMRDSGSTQADENGDIEATTPQPLPYTFNPDAKEGLRSRMENTWSSINKGTSNQIFWEHEWNEHGRKSKLECQAYFETTLGLAEDLIGAMDDTVHQLNLNDEDMTSSIVIANAFENSLGVDVKVRLRNHNGLMYLKDVSILYDQKFEQKSYPKRLQKDYSTQMFHFETMKN